MSDIVKQEAQIVPMDFAAVVNKAIDKNLDAESMERLLAVFERVEATKARQAFASAISAFKDECPPVIRRTPNPQFTVTRNGVKVPRMFASLPDIGQQIQPHLTANGLSYRWGDATITEGRMTIPCFIRHIGGHEESASSTVEIASSAGCSPQQKYGIAESYAMRYSLKKVLGLTDMDEDDVDGSEVETPDPITEHQAANLDAMIDDVGADRVKFLRFLGVTTLSELPATRFQDAVRALESKRGQR